jgi:hypothetical protein
MANMILSTSIRPINSLIFIAARSGGDVPDWVRDKLILSTASCIAVGTYPEPDGPTEVVLGVSSEVDPGGVPAFDGSLETPDRSVVVSTVESATVLECDVWEAETRVRIWLSHPRWPDKIVIGLG